MSAAAAGWSTPDELVAQVQRLWDRGVILGARFESEPRYPLRLRLRRPSRGELGHRFPEVRRWIRELEEQSQAAKGAGYEILWEEINHRQLGKNRIPEAILVPTEADALALIGKKREAARFTALVEATRGVHPELLPWVASKPLVALEHHDEWARLLGTLSWFRARPRCGLYLRQVDVADVDTKFLETRLGLLAELLDLVLPPEAIDPASTGTRGFEKRYGLRSKPALVHLRSLDPALRIGGLMDVAAPVEEVAQLSLDLERIFIVENDITGLAFPAVPRSVLLFGGGYGIERLVQVPWLRGPPVFYWGDLDTHGFNILGVLRDFLPQATSFLMDRETLLRHRFHWVQEGAEQRHLAPVTGLTDAEQEVFRGLCSDTWGPSVRLEQERIRFGHVEATVRERCLR